MISWIEDLRYGFRMLVKTPGVTAIAVLTLGLGIGANTAVFSLIDALMIRPLPYPGADRLVQIKEANLPKGWEESSVASPNFADWKRAATSFETMALYARQELVLTGAQEAEMIRGMHVSAGFFELLGARPALGRGFLPEEDRAAASPVVILGHGLWKRRFASDPGLLGKTIPLNGIAHTVIGVMPAGFSFLYDETELWTPLALDPAKELREAHRYLAVGKLRAGVSLAAAGSELDAIALRLQKQFPETNAGWTVSMNPIWNEMFGHDGRVALLTMYLSVFFVLLIACANVANLILARGATRDREIAIRRAMGAGRARLVRQLLTESLLLALCGGAVGVLVATWGADVLKTIAPPTVPRVQEMRIDATALLYCLALSVATGILFGLAPALQRSRAAVQPLRESGRGSTGVGRHRLLKSLVVSEVALALMLLACGGLMIRSVQKTLTADPGFRTGNLLTARVSLPEARYPEKAQRVAFYRSALEQVRNSPGVVSASLVSTLPLGGTNSWSQIQIEGRPAPVQGDETYVGDQVIGTAYFKTLAVPVRRGRDFTDADNLEAPPVAIINETMARRSWPGEDPLGRRMRWVPGKSAKREIPWATIVGIVADVRHQNLSDPPRPEVYWPQAQEAPDDLILVVRTSADPVSRAAAVRGQIRKVDKDLPLVDVRSFGEVLERRTSGPRALAKVLGGLAAVALLLSGLGIYAMLAFSVHERTPEIGIRMALGAHPRDILRLILRQGFVLVAIGMLLGLAGALAGTRVLSGLLSGLSPTDPATFTAVAVLLAAVALFACYVPARRATRVDPVIALRYE